MSAIATIATALVATPRQAAVVGLVFGIFVAVGFRQWAPRTVAMRVAGAMLWTAGPAWLRVSWFEHSNNQAVTEFLVVISAVAINWLISATALGIRRRESPWSLLKQNLSRDWFGAFAYFGLSAVLMAGQLNGTLRGYLMATIVAVLSLALADAVGGRRIRTFLEDQLAHAGRFLVASRSTEGAVHNVRNQASTLETCLGILDLDGDPRQLRSDMDLVRTAATDIASTLRGLQLVASPRLKLAPNPIDLEQLASKVANLSAAKGRLHGVKVLVDLQSEPAPVRGDPLLLREVIDNLVANAIEASPRGGRVTISTGTREDLSFLTVCDQGPGVPEELRGRLFEPHYTTKPSGTGMGLYSSHGIAREHQGDLRYTGSHFGGAFTLTLPRG